MEIKRDIEREDKKEKEKRNIELASVKRRTEVVKPMIKSLAAVGATVDPDSGQILYKGESYSDIGSFVAGLDKVDSERFEKSLVRETSGVDERLGTLVSSENIPFPEKMTRLGLKIDPENALRLTNGKFKSITDFLNRVNPKDINKLQLEGLVKAGVFDEFEKDNNTPILSNSIGMTTYSNKLSGVYPL